MLSGAAQFGKADQGIFAFWLHSWREQRLLKYIGFNGQGYQVRHCLHPRYFTDLLALQLHAGCAPGKPRLINVSGGVGPTMSLQQLSQWCTERWGAAAVSHQPEPRAYDLPWLVLDHQKATDLWGWSPKISTADVLGEIAAFADTNPNWIKLSA